MADITVTEQDGVARVVFDLAGEKVNKFTAGFMHELGLIVDELARKPLKAAVFTSAKPDIFIAGADIKEIVGIRSVADAKAKALAGQEVFNRLAHLPFPTVAVIDGACMGGGTEFALACTYRVATDADKTSIGLPEVQLGIIPGWGGTQRMPRLIGYPMAMDLILAGKPVNGAKAFKLGLVDACWARAFITDELPGFVAAILGDGKRRILARRERAFGERLMTSALLRPLMFSKAESMLRAKTRGLMKAPHVALDVMRRTVGVPLEQGLSIEADAFAQLAPTWECKCLVDCFFAGDALKKDAGSGLDLKANDKPVKTAGVLGAGVMGGGIAWLFAHNGVDVRLKDIGWDAVAKGYHTVDDYNRQLVKLRKLKDADAALRLQRVAGTLDYSGFNLADVVVEAVVESLDVKKKVLAECEAALRDDCILATNTSSLSVTAMGEALKRPENLVGMHFFNPVNRMPLVEVVAGAKSSPRAVGAIANLSKRLGKTAIVVKDCPGFLVNRILLPYMNEAAKLLQEGGDLEVIDKTIYDFGMPMGPFVLTDEVGIDVGHKVAKILAAGYGERMHVAEVLGSVHEQFKLLGAKGGVGFYIHDKKKGTRRYNPDIDAAVAGVQGELNLTPRSVDKQEIVDRCLLIMVNESARCIEEQVVAKPLFLDLAMVMGTGFPPQRGGPLHYADSLGVANVVASLQRLADRHGSRFAPCELLKSMAAKNERFFPEHAPATATTAVA